MRARRVPVPRVQVRRRSRRSSRRSTSSATAAPRCATRSSRGAAIADAVTWARDMVNTPSKEKPPADMVAAARKLLRGTRRHRAGARRRRSSRRRSSVACSASARARSRRPRFLKMTYAPPGARGKPLALVGKGVVFDSGGLSLKTGGRHGDDEDRHVGRGGGDRARCRRCRTLGVKTRGHRLRAAGREHAERHRDPPGRRADDPQRQDGRGAQHRRRGPADPRRRALARRRRTSRPRSIDLATLTGACVVALGEKIAGLMGNDDAWVDAGAGAPPTAPASRCGRCRCPTDYRKLLESEVADMKNIGRQLRRRAHRRAVPPGVRRRRAVGAPRHRRARAFARRRRRLPHRRAAPASACARCSSWRAPSSRPWPRATARRR